MHVMSITQKRFATISFSLSQYFSTTLSLVFDVEGQQENPSDPFGTDNNDFWTRESSYWEIADCHATTRTECSRSLTDSKKIRGNVTSISTSIAYEA